MCACCAVSSAFCFSKLSKSCLWPWLRFLRRWICCSSCNQRFRPAVVGCFSMTSVRPSGCLGAPEGVPAACGGLGSSGTAVCAAAGAPMPVAPTVAVPTGSGTAGWPCFRPATALSRLSSRVDILCEKATACAFRAGWARGGGAWRVVQAEGGGALGWGDCPAKETGRTGDAGGEGVGLHGGADADAGRGTGSNGGEGGQ